MDEHGEQRIEKIISFYLGEIPDREKEELEQWVNASGEHRVEFKRVITVCHRLRLTLADEEAARMGENVMRECLQRNRRRRTLRIRQYVAYAALLALALGTGLFFYSNLKNPQEVEIKKTGILQAKHGERRAVLRSASGQEWMLGGRNTGQLAIEEHAILKGDSIISTDPLHREDILPTDDYHILTVPQGGEYNLTLTDGTNVWLNSESVLRFPAHFTGDAREVYLTGEAFFEVVSDSVHPFIVRAGEADIKVVGTSFNVMNYADEQRLEVALQKGKVELTAVGSRQVYPLKPGHVATLDKGNDGVSIQEKEITFMGTWRSGYFYFEDMPLEELVVKLERWYQVRFVFADEELKQLCFTGAIKKYRELSYVLRIIGKTKDIAFTDFGEEVRIVRK